MKGRNAQVSRIYKLLNLLESSVFGLSAIEIKDRLNDRGFEVTLRTIYRDIEALKSAGFGIDEKRDDQKNGNKWILDRSTSIKGHFALTSRELLALYLAKGSLLGFKDTEFYKDICSFLDKIYDKIGSKNQEYIKEIEADVHFEPSLAPRVDLSSEIIETIRSACTERQCLSLEYHSVKSSSQTLRKLGPHFLYFANGKLYLVAEDLLDHAIKIFNTQRIKQARMLPDPYIGTITTPQEIFSNTFGVFSGDDPQSITLLFGPKVATYVQEQRWHSTQISTVLSDGSIEVQFNVAITPFLINWILGFGPDICVKLPVSLQKKIQEEALKIVAHYSSL